MRLLALGRSARSGRGAGTLVPARPDWLLGAIAAALVFLAVLALAIAAAADQAAARWEGGVAATATLSVITEEAEIEAQARAALDILRETPGVLEIRVLEPAEQRSLLAPYLGTGIAFDATTLPLMMEVESDRSVLDQSSLDARLAAAAPGAVFDDHSAWRLPLAAAAARQRDLAASAAILLVLVLAGVAAVAARNAAFDAADAIRTLKWLGMRDSRLRRLFVARLARTLAAGGAAGAIAGAVIAGGIEPDHSAAGFGLGFHGWTWVLPALVVASALLLAAVAAAAAVNREIRRWP